MSSPDPGRYWDGQQWLMWDGQQWRPEQAAIAAPHPPPSGYQQPSQFPDRLGYGPSQPSLTSDQTGQNVQAVIAWVLTVLTFGYLLPWAIAATRGKSNAGAIGILNFFVGWTVIGWIASLVMACGAHQVGAPGVNVAVVQTVAYSGGHPQYQAPPPPPPAAFEPPVTAFEPPIAEFTAPPAWVAPPANRRVAGQRRREH